MPVPTPGARSNPGFRRIGLPQDCRSAAAAAGRDWQSTNGSRVSRKPGAIHTPCPYGGDRPWFHCPRCGRRVVVLFLRSGNFMCGRCGRVVYASQSTDEIGRTWIKQRKLERRLDDDWHRPKGMHRTTYDRIGNGIMACEVARDAALCLELERWGLLRQSVVHPMR